MISQIVFSLFFILSLVFLTIRRWKIEKFVQLSKKMKCAIKSYPIVGHAHMFIGDAITRMETFKKFGYEAIKNGGLTYMWLSSKFSIVVADPLDLEVILKTSLEKDDIVRFPQKLIGNGLIFAPVPMWRQRRKVIAPIFSPKNLNNFVEVFARRSDIMADKLKSVAGQGVVSVWQYLSTYTLEAVCETTLDLNLDEQDQERFLESFSMCSKLIAARMLQPWLYFDAVYRLLPGHARFEEHKEIVWGFIDEAVRKKRSLMKMRSKESESTSNMKTFLDLLIEVSGKNRSYTDLELNEETLVIVSAGNDTSAVGVCFTITLLARHPDVQEKVHQELEEVFGDSNRPVNPKDLLHLKYLDAVIKESLRLYPPVPIVVRKMDRDVELPSGITVLKDCGVFIHIWAANRNPKFWGDDAEQFRPERFLEASLKHSAAFMAFSHGPRGCIGYQYAMMSLKTSISTFLRRYRVVAASDDEINQPLTVAFEVMMKDVDGFKVKLEKRKNGSAS